jgi:hypothetical protein
MGVGGVEKLPMYSQNDPGGEVEHGKVVRKKVFFLASTWC